MTLKTYGGYNLMFLICFIGLISATICTYLIDDKTMIKYGDLYYENIGIVGAKVERRASEG
jgi:hypothetical protein